MAHEDLGDTTRHARTCDWWTGAPGTEGVAYERYMANPNIACTCSLKWRSMVRTEREMHVAWRKRAEEAEATLNIPPTIKPNVARPHGDGPRD